MPNDFSFAHTEDVHVLVPPKIRLLHSNASGPEYGTYQVNDCPLKFHQLYKNMQIQNLIVPKLMLYVFNTAYLMTLANYSN